MANFTGAATGALSGAGTGFTVGGPIGAGVGGLVGAIGGLFGGKKKRKKLPTLDKRQQKLNKDQYGGFYGEGPLADLYTYDPKAANDVFDKNYVNPAYRDLNEKGIPSLTGQFRSQGLMQSSYAGDAVGKLVRDVQENLNAKRADFLYKEQSAARKAKQKGIENYQNRTNFDYDNTPGANTSTIDNILASISPNAVSSMQNYFGKRGNNATT